MTERRRQPLVDLPLRPGRPPEPSEPKLDRGPRRTPPGPGRPPPPRRGRRSRAWLWLLPLLLAAGAGIYFFVLRPRPATPVYEPASVDFGRHRIGGEAATIGAVITNGGERPMRLEELRLEGEQAEEFEVASDDCTGRERLPGESCTVELRFVPRAVGIRRAALRPGGNLAWQSPSLPVVGVGIAPRAVLEPAALDFGRQPVAEESASSLIRVSNAGSAPLTLESIELGGEHPDDFRLEQLCTGRTFGPEERCGFRVAFRPRAAGPRRATVRVAGDSVNGPTEALLSGVGLWSGPPFTAEPERLDFGSQRTGTAGGPREVRLVNRSAAARPAPELIAPRAGSGFSIRDDGCQGATLAPGEECALALGFRPGGEGAVEAVLTAREEEGTVNVVLVGTGVAPKLALDRRALDFGDQRTGFRSAPSSLGLRNTGSDTLSVRSVSLRGPQAAAFEVIEDGCSSARLRPGRSCSIRVAFAPSRTGDHVARVELLSDAAREPETVELTGRGTSSTFAVRPGRLDFGSITRGESGERRLEIANDGSARLEVRGLRTEGPAAADYEVATIGCRLDRGLGPGESCVLSVRFLPTADGPRPARLLVSHDGPDSPREVVLGGVATAPLPGLRTSTATMEFGTHAVGGRSGIQTLTLTNTGRGDLVIRDFAMAGRHPDDFQIVPGTCQGVPRIFSGSECSVGVRFVPKAPGRRSGDLVIRHNASGGRTSIRLGGEGS